MSRELSSRPAIRAVLLDVGGTLWPERFTAIPNRHALLTGRLASALPPHSAEAAVAILGRFEARAAEVVAGETQDTNAVVARCAREAGVELSVEETVAARRALCVPVRDFIQPFPGARELLLNVRALGLRTVVVSNAVTRDAATYLEDFTAFGMAHVVDAVVSSVDVGFRKPHRAMFDAALLAAGQQPEQSVMVGNSEVNDIEPAKALGMRTIRMCIEEPPPIATAADAVVASLNEATAVLETWLASTGAAR